METLCRASYDGNVDLVNEVLDTPGITVNGVNNEGMTPLWCAVSGGSVAVLRRLIAAGASVDWRVESGIKAPLLMAAEDGREELVQVLICAGADINITNGTSTVLSRTIASFWNPRVIYNLIAEGADVNKVLEVPNSMAPLHTAAQFNRLQVMEWLLAAGADPNVRTPENSYGQSETESRCTPLYFAALSPGSGAMKLLLQFGADVNAQNCQGDTALHIAAVQGMINKVEMLLEFGADASIKNDRGQTALQAASSRFTFYEMREDPMYTGGAWFPVISLLVAAGDRSWDHVPTPCPGLGRAMLPVWLAAPQDLPYLFARLPKKMKELVHASLRAMHGPLHPEELRMLILATALRLEEI